MASTVDAFIVRAEREKRGKRRAPWGPVVAVPPLAPGWRWRELTCAAVLRTAVGREEEDEADRRGPGVSGREGGEGRAGEAGPS